MTNKKVSYRVVTSDGKPGPWNDVTPEDPDGLCRSRLIALTKRADLVWYGGTVEKRVVTTTETEDITTVHVEANIVVVLESITFPGKKSIKGPFHTKAEARNFIETSWSGRPYQIKRLAPL